MKSLNHLSEQLLLAVKMAEPIESFTNELKVGGPSQLKDLQNDAEKKAFWINIYNAFYQILINKYPSAQKQIFGLKKIEIAGRKFSLDQIEHGILRMGKNKFTTGLFTLPFQYTSFKSLRPSKLDYRIHFTLNCGVASCPPIAFYQVEKLEAQLDLATTSYLGTSTQVDKEKQTITVSRLFLWFYSDFGKKRGIKKILETHLSIKEKNYKIVFAAYNRTSALMNFSE